MTSQQAQKMTKAKKSLRKSAPTKTAKKRLQEVIQKIATLSKDGERYLEYDCGSVRSKWSDYYADYIMKRLEEKGCKVYKFDSFEYLGNWKTIARVLLAIVWEN